MTAYNLFITVGAALGILGQIPNAYKGLLWIVKRTKTKKDDAAVEKLGKIKS